MDWAKGNQPFYDKNDNSSTIGIGLMDPKLYLHNNINYSNDDYKKLILEIVSFLDKKNLKWEFFCNGSIATLYGAIAG